MQQESGFNSLGLDEEELELLKSAADTVAIADTPDPTEYHDPNNIKLELSPGTMGSRLGGGPGGLGATMIPRATRLGGSQGFDPHTPGEINIVDLATNKQITLDLSRTNKDELAKVCDTNICEDFGTIAAIAFHRLAKKQNTEISDYNEKNSGATLNPRAVSSESNFREPPVGGFGLSYVVPKSTKGGTQLVQTRAAKKRGFRNINQPSVPSSKPPNQNSLSFPRPVAEVNMARELSNPSLSAKRASFSSRQAQEEESYPEPEFVSPEAPSFEVHFEVPDVYEMSSHYHEVVLEDNYLVLIYDNNFPGPRFRPQPSTNHIYVNVAGDDRVFKCLVPGIQYTTDRDDNLGNAGKEHVLLLVDEEVDAYKGDPV